MISREVLKLQNVSLIHEHYAFCYTEARRQRRRERHDKVVRQRRSVYEAVQANFGDSIVYGKDDRLKFSFLHHCSSFFVHCVLLLACR